MTGYVEAELTLFVTAGLYALERWREEREGGWLALAAVFAGSAAATKYLGLFFVAAFAVELALAAPPGQRARTLLRFAALSLLVLAPWYGRILIHTGNPVFPFLPQALRRQRLDRGAAVREPGAGRAAGGAARGFPGTSSSSGRAWGSSLPSRRPSFSGLPLVVTGAWRDRRLRRLAILALAYVLAALALPPDVRYLSAVLPALSLALAVELAFLVAPVEGSVPAALCLVPSCRPGAGPGIVSSRQGPLPVTGEQREAIWRRRCRSGRPSGSSTAPGGAAIPSTPSMRRT